MALKLGIVQGNIATSVKLTGDGIRQSLDRYTRGYLELVDRNGDRNPPLRELRGQRGGAALTSQFLEESNGELDGELDGVLMPEGALPILWQGATRDASSLYGAIRERGVTAWIGTFLSQGDRYSQSLITITATGEMLSRYNKVKLVPLGEYIPLENTLGKLIGRLSPIESALTPGTPDQTFLTPWGLAAVAICYEPPFANLIRRQVAAGGQFILTASNLDPYGTVLMAQHEAQDVMRAIEGDRWLVRATNTGYSGFITPHGQVQWRSPAHQYVTHAETIYRRQGQTLYSRWGNWLVPVLLITAVLVLFL
jgi:apolipoprotein N-acyltransferase